MTYMDIMCWAATDEIEKIAAVVGPGMGALGGAARAARAVGDWTAHGWNNQGGKLWTGINLGMTALQLPSAMKAEDPQGLGRSRSERVLGLGAETIGGFTGMGFGQKFLPTKGVKGFFAQGAANMLGGSLARKAVTAPFAMARKRKARMMAQYGQQPGFTPPQEQQGGVDSMAQSPSAVEGRELL